MNKLALVILVVPLILSGCDSPQIKSVRETATQETSVYHTNKIKIQDGQLIPDKISVSIGDEVTFTNNDNSSYTVASDPHPEHSELPDLYSPPIYPGKSYKYKFTKEGYFGVHLEENPSIKGQIIVTSPGGENNDNK